MPRFGVEQARGFLRLLGGPFARTAERSPAYVQRIAGQVADQQARGLPPSLQAARGHVSTPEHPGRTAPKTAPLAREYRAPVVRPKETHLEGRSRVSGELGRKDATERALREFGALGGGRNGNVQISLRRKDGREALIGGKYGWRPEALQAFIAQYDRLRDAIAALVELVYGKAQVPQFDLSSFTLVSY